MTQSAFLGSLLPVLSGLLTIAAPLLTSCAERQAGDSKLDSLEAQLTGTGSVLPEGTLATVSLVAEPRIPDATANSLSSETVEISSLPASIAVGVPSEGLDPEWYPDGEANWWLTAAVDVDGDGRSCVGDFRGMSASTQDVGELEHATIELVPVTSNYECGTKLDVQVSALESVTLTSVSQVSWSLVGSCRSSGEEHATKTLDAGEGPVRGWPVQISADVPPSVDSVVDADSAGFWGAQFTYTFSVSIDVDGDGRLCAGDLTGSAEAGGVETLSLELHALDASACPPDQD